MEKLTLGELIRKRRRELNWTQAELAKRVRVKDSYIAKIETGRQRGSYEVLARISLAMRLPWQLMFETGEIRLPVWGIDDSLSPVDDKVFTEFHPKVKSILIEIGNILEKNL